MQQHNVIVLAFLLTAMGCRGDRAGSETQPADSVITAAQPAVDVTAADTSTLIDCNAVPTARDRSICPGQRVGALSANSTRMDLVGIYGTTAVRDDSVSLGEGEYAKGLIIKVSEDDSLIVTLEQDTLIGFARIWSKGWQTPEGLRIGSSLDDLERVYGKVRVYGFGFDGAGAVELPDSAKGMFFRVYPSVPDDQHTAAWNKVSTGTPYPSDDPDLRILKPVVTEIRLTFRSPWD